MSHPGIGKDESPFGVATHREFYSNFMSNYTFFWNNRTPFSNWYPSVFIWNGIRFTRGEQYMMYRKAMLFDDWDVADQILATDDPAKQKDLGRQVKNYDDELWSSVRFEIMVEGLFEKFNQNPQLKQALLETRGTEMVEASPYDRIWGIGLAASDPRAQEKNTWLGQNLLGEVLDDVRNRLDVE